MEYTAAELAELHAYHSPRHLAALLDFVLTPLVLVLLVRFGTRPFWTVSGRLAARVPRLDAVLRRLWRGPGAVQALLFAIIFFGCYGLIDVPLEVGFGYFHEHAFGLSRMTPAVFVIDLLKGKLVFATAVSALVLGLFGLARRTRRWWLLLGVSAGALMLVATAIDPYRSRLYVDQSALPEGPLRDQITSLMQRAGIDFSDVLIEHTASRSVRVQAFFAGTGPTRTIVLNDALLTTLSTEQVLAAVAHEAGHVNEPRWPGRLAAGLALLLFLALMERLFVESSSRGWFGVTERADARVLPLSVLVFTVLMMAANPISGALSRQRELEADQFAVDLTQDRSAFREMLVKAARTNKLDPEPPRWAVLRGLSHPPIQDRLRALDSGGP